MTRKTKEQAEVTRLNLIKAARELFLSQGVSHTTLEQIAKHAGYTRGAIYWHFSSKVEIFQALCDSVSNPLTDRLDGFLFDSNANPLDAIENTIHELFNTLESDQVVRETFMIMNNKCDYSGEFRFLKQKTEKPRDECLDKLKALYGSAIEKGMLAKTIQPQVCAQVTHSFIIGSIELWVADEGACGIRIDIHKTIKSFFDLLKNLMQLNSIN